MTERVYEVFRERDAGPWDAIVVGSGMGGMSCTAALAKCGKKVLVLEQHYIPGGFTHVFSRHGYTWDVGIHAVGEMEKREIPARMLAWLSDGRVKMESLGNPYDRFFFPDGFQIEFPASKEEFRILLKQKFPQEADAVDRYFRLVDRVALATMSFFAGKSFPEWLDRVMDAVVRNVSGDWWRKTTEEILDGLTEDDRLKAVLTAQWGYYGSPPSQSSFALHALTVKHFWNGAYYPVGGSKVIAEELLRVVQKAGGQTLVKAPVQKILIENNQAVGVRLENGEEIFAPIVISAAGARTTFENLLPQSERPTSLQTAASAVSSLRDSPSYTCMNFGFKGELLTAGAAPSNFWFMNTWDMNRSLWDVNDPKTVPPILYVSFPSLKDPLHDPGPEKRHTGECIPFVPWDAFEKWKGSKLGRREADYLEFKEMIEERLVAELKERLPRVFALLDYQELSTPLTTEFFTRASHGAIYGLESTPRRFTNKKLRTRTSIKGLYLTGSDVTTLGIAGAMTSGLLTAATIDKKIYPKLL